jgi:hypothetical protein
MPRLAKKEMNLIIMLCYKYLWSSNRFCANAIPAIAVSIFYQINGNN